jgi:hypothetical protein
MKENSPPFFCRTIPIPLRQPKCNQNQKENLSAATLNIKTFKLYQSELLTTKDHEKGFFFSEYVTQSRGGTNSWDASLPRQSISTLRTQVCRTKKDVDEPK